MTENQSTDSLSFSLTLQEKNFVCIQDNLCEKIELKIPKVSIVRLTLEAHDCLRYLVTKERMMKDVHKIKDDKARLNIM